MSKPVTLDRAAAVVAAARKRAEEMGVAMNIAVVDDGGNLVAFARMDGAWLGSIEIAQDKAWTARAFNISTKELAAMSQPRQPLFGIAETHRGRVIIFAGGIPLKAGGQVVGAVGVNSYDLRFPFAKYLREATLFPIYDAGNMGMQRRRLHGVLASAEFNPRAVMDNEYVEFKKAMEAIDTVPADGVAKHEQAAVTA